MADPGDPAVWEIERLQADFPGVSIHLIHSTSSAPNGKVAVLADLERHAKFPLRLVNDSDIVVEPRYLRQVLAPLNDARIGMVTCLYRASAVHWPGRWEATGIATDFAPSVLVAPLFGGLPATGVLARTATNIRSGAGSPVAGIIHAVFLLLVLLVAAPLFTDVPLATLAAVLAVVAVRMGEWEEFSLLHKKPRGDAAVFLITFSLTVLFDLTVAVEVGMVLAAFLFIKRVADTTKIHEMTGEEAAAGGPGHEPVKNVPPGVMIYRVFGALLFGSAEKLESIIRRTGSDTRVVILHLAAVTAMDATALNRVETLHAKLRRHGKHLVLSGPHTQPYFMMEKADFFDVLGRVNVAADLESAVVRARELLAGK